MLQLLAAALIACSTLTAVDGDTVKCDGVRMRLLGAGEPFKSGNRHIRDAQCQVPARARSLDEGKGAPRRDLTHAWPARRSRINPSNAASLTISCLTRLIFSLSRSVLGGDRFARLLPVSAVELMQVPRNAFLN